MTATFQQPTEPLNPPGDDEAQLVLALKAGNDDAFEQLVRAYAGRMLSVAKRFLSAEDCDDAVQETFISALQNIDRFESNARLWTWLYRILVNCCLMKIRSAKRSRTISIEETLPQFDRTGHHISHPRAWPDDPLAQASQSEMQAKVRDSIDLLPQSYREVLLLRDIEQRDTDETADILGCTRANVKTRLHRARQALRTILEPIVLDA